MSAESPNPRLNERQVKEFCQGCQNLQLNATCKVMTQREQYLTVLEDFCDKAVINGRPSFKGYDPAAELMPPKKLVQPEDYEY